mmetsp:Transcript_105184/g.274591  ORF Transcript_105184/g.274591 Transcript_105184/m.274591 type:complete len:244 (-) Transcript_105184:982-1713(-)
MHGTPVCGLGFAPQGSGGSGPPRPAVAVVQHCTQDEAFLKGWKAAAAVSWQSTPRQTPSLLREKSSMGSAPRKSRHLARNTSSPQSSQASSATQRSTFSLYSSRPPLDMASNEPYIIGYSGFSGCSLQFRTKLFEPVPGLRWSRSLSTKTTASGSALIAQSNFRMVVRVRMTFHANMNSCAFPAVPSFETPTSTPWNRIVLTSPTRPPGPWPIVHSSWLATAKLSHPKMPAPLLSCSLITSAS